MGSTGKLRSPPSKGKVPGKHKFQPQQLSEMDTLLQDSKLLDTKNSLSKTSPIHIQGTQVGRKTQVSPD